MEEEKTEKELFKVVLNALKKETNDPSEVCTALAQALALSLQASQDVTGDKEGVKEAARNTFNKILDML